MAWFKSNVLSSSSWEGGEIVTFADGTDEQIAAMLNAYYNDEITWQKMGWAVGDTRKIHLDAMSAPSPNSSNTLAAQDITIVIVDHNHTDLATSINGHNKACITVQTKEVLHKGSKSYGNPGDIYYQGFKGTGTTFYPWSSVYLRTYLNSIVYNAFQSDFKSMIKASKHYRHTAYNTSVAEQVTDNIFLPSYPEMHDITQTLVLYTITDPPEGTQFEYYKTSANKIKCGNNNGISDGIARYYWTGSASNNYDSSYGYRWCTIMPAGGASRDTCAYANALAPAWVM